MKSLKAIAWVILVGAPLFLTFGYVREALLVDSCLDSGGSFDYARMICDRQVSHVFIPYSQRHFPFIIATSVGTVVAAVYLVINWGNPRARKSKNLGDQ